MKLTVNEHSVKDLIKKYEEYKKQSIIRVDILSNLKLLTKKDGKDYQNMLKAFDIESLNKYIKEKYRADARATHSESEYDYAINLYLYDKYFSIRLPKRIYIDELSQEELAKVDKSKIVLPAYIRAYYNIYSTKELQEEINKIIDSNKAQIEKYENNLKKLPELVDALNEFTSTCNEILKDTSLSYYSDITSLISQL